MRPRAACLIASLVLSGAAVGAQTAPDTADLPFAPPVAPTLEAPELERLAGGGVVVRALQPTDGVGLAVLMMGTVDAAPERVWHVMQDCEAQDEFMPRVLVAEVRDRERDTHVCELVLDMPYPLDDARTLSRHHVRRLPDGGYQRHWDLLPPNESYHRNRGSWSVHPHGEGHSLVVSRMEVHPKSALPVWLLRRAQSRQAPVTFDAIRRRVLEEAKRAGVEAE